MNQIADILLNLPQQLEPFSATDNLLFFDTRSLAIARGITEEDDGAEEGEESGMLYTSLFYFFIYQNSIMNSSVCTSVDFRYW
jgi:hypothetical protein